MGNGIGETVSAATGLLRSLGQGGDGGGSGRTYTCDRCVAALAGRAEWLMGGLCEVCRKWRTEQEALEQRRRVDARVRAALAGIPALFQDARFGPVLDHRVGDPVASTTAWRLIANAAQPLPPIITLHGPPGGGKTTLAAAILHRLGARALDGIPHDQRLVEGALWVSAARLADAQSEHGLGDGDAPLVAAARAATLLIVDDLGKENPHPSRRGVLEQVLRDRIDLGSPLIVTTELDGGGVVRAYTTGTSSGEHLQRRLFASGAVVIPVGVGLRAA